MNICSFSGLHEEQNKSQCFSGALSPVYLPTWKMCDVKIPLQGLYTSLVLWDALTQPAPHLYHPLQPGNCLQIWSLSDLVSTRLIHGRKLILCCFHNICLSKLITVTGNHTSLVWGLAAWVDFPGREPEHTGLRGGVAIQLILLDPGKVLTAVLHRWGLWKKEAKNALVNIRGGNTFFKGSRWCSGTDTCGCRVCIGSWDSQLWAEANQRPGKRAGVQTRDLREFWDPPFCSTSTSD